MTIVKIGGGAAINLPAIVADLESIEGPFLIVHGANALRDEIATVHNRPKKVITSLSGYTSVYSDSTAIDLIMMAYAGLRNKRLVELLQQNGINAVGLSGLDGRMVSGRRNRGIRTMQDGKKVLLRDFSGKPHTINLELLHLLLDREYTPVLCIPIIDEDGYAINSENDDIVALLQNELQAHVVFHLIEAPGLLDDVEDPGSLVSQLTSSDLATREQEVEGRMRRKILALRKLFHNGSPIVYIADGRSETPIRDALAGRGTRIQS